jgi:hypothetical protein
MARPEAENSSAATEHSGFPNAHSHTFLKLGIGASSGRVFAGCHCLESVTSSELMMLRIILCTCTSEQGVVESW